ncbi:hypothetical protein MHU86_23861 [Fragilaria crotonensis]|nr:hypothetical protein MHU86_23861 [Fragilaria crotonensis]
MSLAPSVPTVPTALLVSFFEKATEELVSLSWDSSNSSMTLSDFRILILKTQQSALSSVVQDYQQKPPSSASTNNTDTDSEEVITVEQVQNQLQSLETHVDYATRLERPLRNMTMAARQASARLVLQQALKNQQQQSVRSTKFSSPPLTRTAVLDFCGLCQAAVQLDAVQEFLSCRFSSPIVRGNNHPTLRLYDTDVVGKFAFPHERMQYIQKLFFTALGYHADTANQQLQGLVEGDAELEQIFTDTIHQLRQVLAVATMHMQQEELNDFEQGGVTRVVSVTHSNSNHDDNEMPQTIGMVRSDQDNNDNNDGEDNDMTVRMARDTAALEQTLLAQLLQMDSDERTLVLEQARVAHDELMAALSNLTTPSERVAYMTSSTALSKETRKLLLLHQIWQGLLDRNGGQPPKMASTRDRDY